jgi:zinc protease
MENVNGSNTYVIDVVNGKGNKSVEYYDEANGLLVRKVQGEGETMKTSDYSDYREIPGANGYKVPYKVTESGAGNPTITEQVQSVEVNKGIADAEFD